jgi:hypothetical protein
LVTPQLKMIMDNLLFPDAKFGSQPVQGRNDFLFKTFEKAIQNV